MRFAITRYELGRYLMVIALAVKESGAGIRPEILVAGGAVPIDGHRQFLRLLIAPTQCDVPSAASGMCASRSW